MPHPKEHLVFGPLMAGLVQPRPVLRAVITDPLYKRMVANPEQRVPFLLTEKALAVR